MEQALPEGVVQEQAGASVKGARVKVGWEERALEPDPVGIVSAPVVEQKFLTR